MLYGTGFRHASSLTATVNGVPYAGLDEINLSLPGSLAGAGLADIVVTVDGGAANPVSIAIP